MKSRTLEELTIDEQKEFWDNIRERFPQAFNALVKWSGWNEISITSQKKFFYYDAEKIRNLNDFFIEHGFILNPNPQISMGKEIHFHPHIIEIASAKLHRFWLHYPKLKEAEHFLYINGFELLNIKENQTHERI